MPAQGDTEVTRDGNKIMVKSFALRYRLTWSTALTTNGARVILLYDRNTQLVLPTAANVLWTAAAQNLRPGYNTDPSVRGRFQIIFDRTYSTTADSTTIWDKFYIRKDMPVLFDGALGGPGNIDKGALVLMIACGGANTCTMLYDYILRYEDC